MQVVQAFEVNVMQALFIQFHPVLNVPLSHLFQHVTSTMFTRQAWPPISLRILVKSKVSQQSHSCVYGEA
jgi:hypothetical protein